MNITEWEEIFPEAKQVIKQSLVENLRDLKFAIEKSICLAKKYIITSDIKFLVFLEMIEKEILVLEPRIKRLIWELKTLERKNESKEINSEELKNGIDLRQVAENYGIKFKNRNGKEWMACCPFHKERNPSCSFSKRLYYCFSCGESGDVISLVEKLDNCSFKEAVDKLT